MQINLCTLAMRQQQMLDIFNKPATSSSRLHITVKSAAGDEVKAMLQPWQSFTMPHACFQGTAALQLLHISHGSQHASCMSPSPELHAKQVFFNECASTENLSYRRTAAAVACII